VAVTTGNGDDEETATEGIRPEEISPELMYTAEHQVPTVRANIVSEHRPDGDANGRGEGEGPGKRRRGRRGGRRGRGGDDTPPGTS
jgi:hypothetical protein